MEKKKYELRSDEVQEVMKSPPNILIRWGNTLVIALFFLALLIANNFKLPVKIKIPCKILSIAYHAKDKRCLVQILVESRMPESISGGQKALLSLDNMLAAKLGRLPAVIYKTGKQNQITLSIKITERNRMLTNNNEEIIISEGMLGTVEIFVGEKSMLMMFWEKVSGN